jgi:transposase-like protein
MFLIRGVVFSHETVRDWETKLVPGLAKSLRRRRRGKAGFATNSHKEKCAFPYTNAGWV